MIKTGFRASVLGFVCLCCLAVSCKDGKNKNAVYDTPKSGTIHISIDESFRPVMEEQIAMYEASYPGTHIIAHYKPEAECIRDLFKDTTNRMVIITRGLEDNEEKFFLDSLKFRPAWNAVATDAVAVLLHKESTD